MEEACGLTHPLEFHTPGWHAAANTPVVDGKYLDRATGQVRTAADHVEYDGPPAVDIIIRNVHESSVECVFRAARPFPLRALLCHMARLLEEKNIELDSLFAAPYAIRVTLAHEFTHEEFYDIAIEMANGIWSRK
ncbi:hypothetical protein JDV02_010250 [Purpureocillium takamizusanense]|uniref:Uncharacterized protein n=1 Tax=Purpureocillium takamizusanense TaxID=2060973 RepID=A0A9Q8QTF3_9HYPO|nr:uncharacterized protein JDV02_010250 [Purpureocillium takamizusanense]UNI24511.1 hypothetical protein JDV02_010250 [Purpureocillium takamizusanense]